MKTTLQLTKRNLLLFFRNKAEVFFSFLSVIIILGLYVLFLSDLQVKGIKDTVGDIEGVKALVNSWVMAGLIAVSTVTLALGALGRIVTDRENKSINDFLVAPIKRTNVFMSYILSTLTITFIISTVLFVIAELYILSSGGTLLSFIQIIEFMAIIILCVLSSSLLMLFVVSFMKNIQAFSVVSTIIGTLIGFVTGAYIPVGILPEGVQLVSNVLPVSQGAALFRQILLAEPLKQVFTNAPKEALSSYRQMQGVDLSINGHILSSQFMILFILGSIVVFMILNILRFRKMKN
jgi:multidrug/hemolysin transport system permease protein